MSIILLIGFIAVAWSDAPGKKLFLIGDSISVHYWPYLKSYLSGHAGIERKK
jgi:hypothetical protein